MAADVDNMVLYINRAAETLLGWPSSDLIGQPLTVIMPERFRARHRAGFDRFVRTRESSVLGQPLRLPAVRMDGTEIEVELVVSTAELPFGTILLGLLRDMSERVELEGSGELTDALAGALAESETLTEALARVLEGLGQSLDWDVVQLWLVDHDDRALRRRAGWSQGPQAYATFMESGEDLFMRGVGLPGRVWASVAPAWIEDVTLDAEFARAAAAAVVGLHAAFAFPLLAHGRVVGVVEMLSRQPHGVSVGLVQQMRALGSRLGGFIERRVAEEDRLSLLESERAARSVAELARSRLIFLSEASIAFSESLDLHVTLDRVASLAVPALGDWCVIHLAAGDRVAVAAVAHSDPDKVALLRTAHDRYPVDVAAAGGVGKSFATGDVVRHHDVSDEVLSAIARSDEHLSLLRQLGFGAVVTVPLRARQRQLGTITVATSRGRVLDDETVDTVVEVARRAATAIDNAQLHTELQSHAATSAALARTLQQSLLPPALPQIPGLDLAAQYVPATLGMDIGGDFYDVFRLGRATWGVVVGDVCGHGAEAAAVTAFARYTLRAAAGSTRSPARALRLLNDTMLRQRAEAGSHRFVTILNARATVRRGSVAITFSIGGHPLPVLRRHDGSTVAIGQPGTLLGALDDVALHDTEVVLESGDRLVIVTDGVLEARRGAEQFGEPRLLDLVCRSGNLTPGELAAAVADAATTYAGGTLTDDIAVLVLAVPQSR